MNILKVERSYFIQNKTKIESSITVSILDECYLLGLDATLCGNQLIGTNDDDLPSHATITYLYACTAH